MLAVSSKNDDASRARGRSAKHPEMLLREHHIAVFQANWNDKATNIKAIAEELSLGLDADGVRRRQPGGARAWSANLLPQVAVPELPDDPGAVCPHPARRGLFRGRRVLRRRPQARRISTRTTPSGSRCSSRSAAWTPISPRWTWRSPSAPFDRDRARAHRPAHQQVEPVQPDHAPLHRGGGRRGRGGSRRLHAAGAAGGQVRRQRDDQSVVICAPGGASRAGRSTPG